MHGDTIVALSTPPGTSGLAVIRLSGPACRGLMELHLSGSDRLVRHMHHGAFREKPGGEILDRLNFVFMSAPATVTGEDVLELYPHGNMLLVERMVACLLGSQGLRLAGPGEFTRRSFENGKIDLLQAEAVGQLIHAQTRQALRNAQWTLAGGLSLPLRALRDQLLDLSVRLELDVDFSEEEVDPDYASWRARVREILDSLETLARGFERGRTLGRAPRIVLLGSPNAGKSSLINALVEEERLLVSDVPGTTRDYVEVPLHLGGGVVHLVDTAGLGKPVDGLDAMAMERTRAQGERADLRVLVRDGTSDAPEPGFPGEGDFALRVATRSDLPGFLDPEGYLPVSNLSKQGLGELVARLEALAFRGDPVGEDIVLTTQRQFQAIAAARDRVRAALENLESRPAIEIIAFEIKEAAGHLRELLGEISTEQVLQKIFAGFCIGK